MNGSTNIIDLLRDYIDEKKSILPVLLDPEKIHNAVVRMTEGFDSIGDCLDEVQDLERYKEDLANKLANLEDVARNLQAHAVIDISTQIVQDYCVAFYSVIKSVVFSKNNRNLRNDDFRQSRFLEYLTTLFAEKQDENYCFNILDPFICQTIIDASSFKKLFSKNDRLFKLRREMFLENVFSTFDRCLSIQRNRFKLHLQKEEYVFQAVPYERLSSVCSIDPMRMYEHIISYIESRKEKWSVNDQFEVSICIIGELERENYSLEDLCKAVVGWYEVFSTESEMIDTKLVLRIKQIVNKQFDFNEEVNEKELKWIQGNKGPLDEYYCTVAEMNFGKQFTYSTKILKSIIADNEITFVVDCPWLYREEVRTGFKNELDSQIASLEYIGNQSEPEAVYSNFGMYYKGAASGRISDMLYEMMESPKLINGKIERFLKNNVISDIISYVKSENKESKEVFVVCSDYHAYRYSDAFVYPLTKNEKYDGKDYSVIKFTNTQTKTLPKPKSGKTEIVMDLWSILKYLSMTYYRRCFEKIIRDCAEVEQRKISSAEILEISKGIKVRLLIEYIHNVKVSIEIDNYARKHLWQNENSGAVEIKKADCEWLKSFINNLFRTAFTDNGEYGDEAIKTCVEINMYNSAKNVMDMLFINRYRCAMNRGMDHYFDVRYAEDIEVKEQDDCRIELPDRFMDKKIYSYLLSSAEQSSEQNIYLELLCNDDNGLLPKKVEERLPYYIENALLACEKAKEMDTELYRNLQKMLSTESRYLTPGCEF